MANLYKAIGTASSGLAEGSTYLQSTFLPENDVGKLFLIEFLISGAAALLAAGAWAGGPAWLVSTNLIAGVAEDVAAYLASGSDSAEDNQIEVSS
jgi:hypothetical protein